MPVGPTRLFPPNSQDTGLGLYIVAKIVEALGGSVDGWWCQNSRAAYGLEAARFFLRSSL